MNEDKRIALTKSSMKNYQNCMRQIKEIEAANRNVDQVSLFFDEIS